MKYILLLTLMATGCELNYSEFGKSIRYFKDPRANICFALDINITYVPCELIPDSLLKNQQGEKE